MRKTLVFRTLREGASVSLVTHISPHDTVRKMLSTGIKPIGLDALVGLAHLQVQTGQTSQALQLVALVNHHPASDFSIKQKGGKLWGALSAETPSTVVAEAEARGKVLDLWDSAEQIIANSQSRGGYLQLKPV